MHSLERMVLPDRGAFEQDPFGYSILAWHKWGMAQVVAGLDVDPTHPASDDDLKSPVLWLAQAHALSEAASTLVRTRPNWQSMPSAVQGVCDTQFCATALMLIGYSLEVCLKGMLILQHGAVAYAAEEKKHRHHRLEELAAIIPELSDRDRAILRGLTHFVTWAGRYPDPGQGKSRHLEEIFASSEQHQVSAKDLFELSSRIMRHINIIVSKLPEC